MGKKPTTFTEKDHKNYEEGKDVVPVGSLFNQYLEDQAEKGFEETPKTFVDCERFITKEVPNASEPPKIDNDPSWDSEEHIWSASHARKRADTYGVRSLRNGQREVMRYVKTAADSGQYECTVYNDNISADVAIDSIIKNLEERGYTVKKFEQYGGWYVKISW